MIYMAGAVEAAQVSASHGGTSERGWVNWNACEDGC